MEEERKVNEENKKIGDSTCGPSDNYTDPSRLGEQYISTDIIPKTVMIDGKSYNSIDAYRKKSHKKYLFKVGENHYWAIGKKSELCTNLNILENLIAWVNEKVAEYNLSGKTVFDEENKSETTEFSEMVGFSKDTVLKWIRQYLVSLRGLKLGLTIYEKIFASSKTKKQMKWHSYEFLQNLVKKISFIKVGQKAELLTSKSKFNRILIKCNFKNSKIKRAKIKINCPIHGEFQISFEDLYYEHWCRKCGFDNTSLSIDELRQKGSDYGYTLKETVHTFKKKREIQGKKPYETVFSWECLAGHPNEKSLRNLKKWGCMDCWRLSRMLTYDKFLEVVYEAGFKTKVNKKEFIQLKKECLEKRLFLSHDIYFNLFCSEGHDFEKTYISLKGARCPYCGMTKLQLKIHKYMEAALDIPFEAEVDVRRIIPTEIKYLRVDGYAVIYLRGKLVIIVFEAMGKQHRELVNKYHKSPLDLKAQIERDKYLRKLLKENGIVLIEFWYDHRPSQYKKLLIDQFKEQTKELGIFEDGYELQNVPQFTVKILHNKFLGNKQKTLDSFPISFNVDSNSNL